MEEGTKGFFMPWDFNMRVTDPNGTFVRLAELTKMVEYGAVTVDRGKMEERKYETTVVHL